VAELHRLTSRHPIRRLLSALVSPHSYGSVLLLIVVSYVASTSSASWVASLVLAIQIATVWLALRVSQTRRPLRMLSSALFAVAVVVAIANISASDSKGLTTIVFTTSSLLYFIAPLSILRHIVAGREVGLETVLGAIDAYLLVGMFFAFVYQALAFGQSGAFFAGGIEGSVSQSLFFSFTTLTTTGYGNLVPAGNPGQTLAVMEMLIGQLLLVTAVAKVINAWRPERWRAAGPAEDATTGPEGDAEPASD
jgi:hypothetical protein